MLTITVFHQYFNSLDDSGSTRLYEMSKRLVKEGWRVKIITSSRDDGFHWWRTSQLEGVELVTIGIPYSQKFGLGRRLVSFILFGLFAFFRGLLSRADLYFASSTPLSVGVIGLACSLITRKRFVFEVRDVWPEVPVALGVIRSKCLVFISSWAAKRVYSGASVIITLSPDMKSMICASGVNPRKIAVVPNACDFDLFSKGYLQGSRAGRQIDLPSKFILYAGSVGRVNYLEFLIFLGAALRDIRSNVFIVIMGDGSELDRIVKFAESLSLAGSRIIFIPPVSKREASFFFNEASMICNSVIDVSAAFSNSANKFFDGMACGKPLLINHGGWMEPFVKYYCIGVAAYLRGYEEVAREVDDLLNDEGKYLRVCENSKSVGLAFFDRERIFLDTLACFDFALSEIGSPPSEIAPGHYYD